jgi:hypothetical protein
MNEQRRKNMIVKFENDYCLIMFRMEKTDMTDDDYSKMLDKVIADNFEFFHTAYLAHLFDSHLHV